LIAARSGFRLVQRRIAILRRAVAAEVEDRYRLIYHVLRGGVVVSVAILVFAFALLVASPRAVADGSIPPRALTGPLSAFAPEGYLSLGVLVLIFTPVARVFLSFLSFLEERDSKYVIMTGLVFVNLLASLIVLA
jgi:uncharacterized membrane protein